LLPDLLVLGPWGVETGHGGLGEEPDLAVTMRGVRFEERAVDGRED
jgi:hypothetical protein